MKGYRPKPTDPVISLNEDARLIVFVALDDLANERSAPREVRGMARALSGLFSRARECFLGKDPMYRTWTRPAADASQRRLRPVDKARGSRDATKKRAGRARAGRKAK